MQKRVVIMGAAGRDFHNFLTYFKNDPHFKVICFTAEQIPGIAKRKFPKQLAGKKYPKGIPIFKESQLPQIIKKYKIDTVCLSYSDLPHIDVMHKASLALAAGANFLLLGPHHTQIKSKVPLVSITAVRTGSGKSQTSRKVAQILKAQGKRIVAIRHPMPYGDLVKQEVQRFAEYDDLIKHKCTIEEREEYNPWIELGIPIYAGVDYKKILHQAEREADIIIWDGGNNDFSFYKPDLDIVVVDPLRAGHERLFYPGETNFLRADVIVINKAKQATKEELKKIQENIKKYNPKAKVITAASKLIVNGVLKKRRVLVVGDGPTLTHGGMSYGAGTVAAQKAGATMVDPRPHAVGSIKALYKKFPHLGKELPAMGYSKKQIKELTQTINRSKAAVIVDGTPFNLGRFLQVKKPIVTVDYVLEEIGKPTIKSVLKGLKRK